MQCHLKVKAGRATLLLCEGGRRVAKRKGILKQELGGANPTYLAVLTSTLPLAQLQGLVQFNKILLTQNWAAM